LICIKRIHTIDDEELRFDESWFLAGGQYLHLFLHAELKYTKEDLLKKNIESLSYFHSTDQRINSLLRNKLTQTS
jgi:hypothetical protein